MDCSPTKGELVEIQFEKNRSARARHARLEAMRGGADRDRTDDLRLAKPALSQLSYSPVGCSLAPGSRERRHHARAAILAVVGLGGFEPPTSRLSGGRSNQLSYRPAPIRRIGSHRTHPPGARAVLPPSLPGIGRPDLGERRTRSGLSKN